MTNRYMGPLGVVLISEQLAQAMHPDPAYHYGEPLITMHRAGGPICLYLVGNGPLGDRVDVVARQVTDQHCQIETRGAGDRVLSSVYLVGIHAQLEAPNHAQD